MKRWLIRVLYGSLDDWAKWEVHQELKCPSLDSVMLEQCRQADRLFKGYQSEDGAPK